ncbi:MAG TPA: outer membrane protein transport protein [Polyangiaceae bacterium]|jgi:long-chain fatty acid transport protein
MRVTKFPVTLALSVVCLLEARASHASGFSVAHFASEHGHPTTDNATALYFNPAALSQADGAHVFADLSVGLRRVTYDRRAEPTDAPDPPDAAGANVGRARLLNTLASPVLAGSLKLGPVVLGVGFFTPFGGIVNWDKRAAFANSRYPGPVDGVSRFQSIEGEFITSELLFGGAYRVPGTPLSFGATFNLMRSLIDDVRAWSGGTNDVRTEGRSLVDVSGYAYGFGLGVLYEALPEQLFLGASYQSRPNVSGGMRLHGSLDNDVGGPSSAHVDVAYDLPDIVRLGARYRPRRALELRLFGDYTRYSAFSHQCLVAAGAPCTLNADGGQPANGQVLQNVPRNFHDSFGVRAGLSLWPSARFEFFSGLGFESSAVPDSTFEAGLPDFAGASFALGGRLALGPHVHVALSYTDFVFVPRTVHGNLASFAQPSQMPDASGHYTQQLGVANTNVDVAF